MKTNMRALPRVAGCIGLALALGPLPLLAAEEPGMFTDLQTQTESPTSQVNTVSELSDVDPASWAFQALKSVVERYGCLEGYPNKTYLGSRPLSRYEFAAGLNACLEKISELIAAGTADKASKDDLAALQRLAEEFRNELAALRGRVAALEDKTREIESKLFSTTAKLDGSVVMAVTGGGAGSNNTVRLPLAGPTLGDSPLINLVEQQLNRLGVPAPFTRARTVTGDAANVSFVARSTLNIRATFSGTDELLVRMRGVTGQDISSVFPGIAGSLGTLFYAGNPNNFSSPAIRGFSYDGSALANVPVNGTAPVTFDKVRYIFSPFGESVRFFVGPRIDLFEVIDTNSFANNEEFDFSNGFFINNPLVTPLFAGPGLGFDWTISKNFSLRAAYIAASGGSALAFGSGGLTGGNNLVAAEFEIRPSVTSSIKLQYSHYVEQNSLFGIDFSLNGTFGQFTRSVTDVAGFNGEWAITPSVAIFGRFGYAFSDVRFQLSSFVSDVVFGPGSTTTLASNLDSTTWSAGLAFPNFVGSPGTLAVVVGQVPRISSSRDFVFTNGTPPPGAPTQAINGFIPSGRETDVELFYRFPITERLTITPDFQLIFDAANIANNPTISVFTLRTVFTF